MSKRIPIDRIVDFAAGRLSQEESLFLLDQIEHDEEASKDLELVTSVMNVVEEEGDALAAERASQSGTMLSRVRKFFDSLLPKLQAHPVLSGAAAFALVFAALMMALPASSPYGSLASMQDFDFGVTVRGVDLEDFGAAFDLYRDGQYEESIRLFERYIRAFPHSPLLEYAHYSAGAAYLRWSEWRLMSLFIGFDRERVQRGVEHLQEVIRSSANKRLLEDAHWLLAKGRLMQSQEALALDELRFVTQLEGGRREAATAMIQVLRQFEQRR